MVQGLMFRYFLKFKNKKYDFKIGKRQSQTNIN